MKNTINKIKNTATIAILLSLILINHANAQTPVGTGFTYQGELIDNGSPANGLYDIEIFPFSTETGGIGNINDLRTFLNVPVTNGLFTIEIIDFGDVIYSNSQAIWLELSVRKSSVGGNYTFLSPRQRIKAVPYTVQAEFSNEANTASNLSISGTTNDVLVHNGSNWVSGGNKIRVSNVGVSVGTTAIPPSDGLRVGGDTNFDGNLSQNISSTGLPKYLVNVSCLENSNAISGNDLAGTGGGFSLDSTGTPGYCRVNFPASIQGKYWVASSIDIDGGSTSCSLTTPTQLSCQRVTRLGAYQHGDFMVIVY